MFVVRVLALSPSTEGGRRVRRTPPLCAPVEHVEISYYEMGRCPSDGSAFLCFVNISSTSDSISVHCAMPIESNNRNTETTDSGNVGELGSDTARRNSGS